MNVRELQRWHNAQAVRESKAAGSDSETRNTTTYSGDITGMTLNDPALLSILGVGPTAAGVTVTRENALRLNTVAACVNVLAQSVSVLPIEVRQRSAQRQSRQATEHPLSTLLNLQPNAWMTSGDALAVVEWWRQVDGAGYMFADTDANGRISELFPLDSSATQLVRPRDGRAPYYHTVIEGQAFTFLAGEVVHLKAHTWDGIQGQSPIGFLRETIGTGIGARERAARTFANGGISGVIEYEGKWSSKQARDDFSAYWTKAYGSLERSGKVAVMEKGMSFKPVGMTGADAQLIEQSKYIRTEICGYYRVPPHMIGAMEHATFSNIEEQDLFFVKHTILRLVRSWEQELMRKLLTPQELADGYYIRFLLDELLRGDIATRFEAYQKGIQSGFMTRNEAREMEHWNVNDDALDKPLRPLNMDPEGTDPGTPSRPDNTRALEHGSRAAAAVAQRQALASAQPVVNAFLSTLDRREQQALKPAIARASGPEDLRAYVCEWWEQKHVEHARRQAEPVFQLLAGLRGLDLETAGDAVKVFLEERRERLLRNLTETCDEQDAAPCMAVQLAEYLTDDGED